MIVKASESGIANQIPDTPKNFGNKIKLGIGNKATQQSKNRSWLYSFNTLENNLPQQYSQ